MKNSLLITGLSYLVVVGWGCVPMLTNGVSMAFASLPVVPLPIASNPVSADPLVQTSTPTNQKKQPIRTQQTKRLKIEIDVTSPGDLLIKEGQTVTANQLIADRKLERSNLSTQLQEIKLSLERLKLAPEVSKVPPVQIKMLTSSLPPVSYIEEQTQVTAAAARVRDLERKYKLARDFGSTTLPESEKVRMAKIDVKQAIVTVRRQQKKQETLATLEDIDPAVKEHEGVRLAELEKSVAETTAKLEHTVAVEGAAKATRLSKLADIQFEITGAQRDLYLAQARLATAQEKRRQAEFDYKNKQTERAEQIQRTELERVRLMEMGKLASHDREYQIAQLMLKKGQVQKQIDTLGVVRTPHQGTIRRVKLVSQHSNVLRYEVVLVYNVNPTPTPSSKPPQWQEDKT
jgi:hypothetical protein